MNVLWNGSRIKDFTLSKGIRQGVPILPYIFILFMDKLSHLIEEEVSLRNWRSIKASKNGLSISQVMFVDDLFLFARASLEKIQLIA